MRNKFVYSCSIKICVLCLRKHFLFLNLFVLIEGQLLYNIVIFLPYINMNWPQVYTCPLNPEPLPSLSLWVVPENGILVPSFMHSTCTGHLFYIW